MDKASGFGNFKLLTIFSNESNEITDTSNTPVDSSGLSMAIDRLRKIISGDYNEETFNEECRKCLSDWKNSAKFKLADLALELKQDGYPNLADNIFAALDAHFEKSDYYRQYYSDLKGLRELADQPDCKVGACLYGKKLYAGEDGLIQNKEEAEICYLKKSAECGYQPAFQHFLDKHSANQSTSSDRSWFEQLFSKQPDQSTPSAQSKQPAQSPIRPGSKSVVDSDSRIKKAEKFFNEGKFNDAARELKWATQLSCSTIVKIAKNYESKSKIDMALFCYEIAAQSGDKEAKFNCMKIKADRGDAEQQYQLARSYFFGGDNNEYPAKNLATGGKYLMAAAKQKHADARFMVAEMNMNCYLRNQNDVSAIKITSLPSHDLYTDSANPEEAVFKYLSLAAESGHEKAKQLLQMRNETSGDSKQICIVWAAECGSRTAQFVIQKIKADAGDENALIACGKFYRDGGPDKSIPEDNFLLAIKYFTQAVDKGNQEAVSLLIQLHEQCLAQPGHVQPTGNVIGMKTSNNQGKPENDSELLTYPSPQTTIATNVSQLNQPGDETNVQIEQEVTTRSETEKDDQQEVKQENDSELPTPLIDLPPQTSIATNVSQLIQPDDDTNDAQIEQEITTQSENQKNDQQEVKQENDCELLTSLTDLSPQKTIATNVSQVNQPGDDTNAQIEQEITTQSENRKDDQQEVKQENNSKLPTPLTNLFLGSTTPITQPEFQPELQQNNSLTRLTPTTQTTGNAVEETTDNSTTFIFIFLLFAVPFSAALAHNYYKRNS